MKHSASFELEGITESYVYVVPSAVPKKLCKLIIKHFEADVAGQFGGQIQKADINTGKLVALHKQDVKNSTDLRVMERLGERHDLWSDIDNSLCKIIGETWNSYLYTVGAISFITPPFVDSGFQIQKYAVREGLFSPQVDSNCYEVGQRVGACLIYLNDVAQGGETHFPGLDIKIPCREGTIVWFPAGYTHVHEGLPPISNEKYLISTFMEFGRNYEG